jgi:hypothetical protein
MGAVKFCVREFVTDTLLRGLLGREDAIDVATWILGLPLT